MDKVVSNALLYSTRQPMMCFTVRFTEYKDGEDRREASRESPREVGGRTCVLLCSLTPF